MINKVIERVENAVYGEKKHNLEINLEKTLQCDEKTARKIIKYTGSFIVTEKGYLLGGFYDGLEKRYAVIKDVSILPPEITYENGYTDKIIQDIFGLRLAQLIYEPKKSKIAFAGALA